MHNIPRQKEVIKILLSILFTYLFTYCILALFTLRTKKELWKHNGDSFNLLRAVCPLEKYCLVYWMHIIKFILLTTEKQILQYPTHIVYLLNKGGKCDIIKILRLSSKFFITK